MTETRSEYQAGPGGRVTSAPQQAMAQMERIIAAAQAVSDAWESDDLSREHTLEIMRLMQELRAVLEEQL